MTDYSRQLRPTHIADGVELARPKGSSAADCSSLRTRISPHPVWGFTFLSRWTLTDEQRQQIAAGADIYLEVCGQHPPVMIFAGSSDPRDSSDDNPSVDHSPD